jgi:hypothetical protein
VLLSVPGGNILGGGGVFTERGFIGCAPNVNILGVGAFTPVIFDGSSGVNILGGGMFTS